MKLALAAAAAAAATLGLAATTARAETTATSTIVQIKVHEPSHPEHRAFHGAVWLDHDKAKHSYRWGGAHCGGQGLSEQSVALLHAAFRSRDFVSLEYRRHEHQKRRFRCITGFTISKP
jgi:hypothetical protein